MEITPTSTFSSKYKALREKYTTLVEINEEFQEKIEQNIFHNNNYDVTHRYIYASSFAAIIITLIALIIFIPIESYKRLSILATYLINYLKVLDNKLTLIVFGAFITGVLFYVFLLPIVGIERAIGNLKNKKSKIHRYDNVDWHDKSFILYLIVVAYITVVLTFTIILITNENHLEILGILWCFLLLLPFVIVIIGLFFYFTLFILLIKGLRNSDVPFLSTKILHSIVYLLQSFDKIDNIQTISSKKMNWLIRRINNIAFQLKYYPIHLKKDHLRHDFDEIALGFKKYGDYLVLPKEDTLKYIKSQLIIYINCLIKGDFDSLPREKCERVIHPRKILIEFVKFGIFLTLPIILFFGVTQIFNIDIKEVNLPFLGFLYLVWVLIVLTTSPTIINQERIEVIKEIIKVFRSKE